jgi:hypothetical protein
MHRMTALLQPEHLSVIEPSPTNLGTKKQGDFNLDASLEVTLVLRHTRVTWVLESKYVLEGFVCQVVHMWRFF